MDVTIEKQNNKITIFVNAEKTRVIEILWKVELKYKFLK